MLWSMGGGEMSKCKIIRKVGVFYRGLRAKRDMRHLLILAGDAESLVASAEWRDALWKVLALLDAEKESIRREKSSLERCESNKVLFLQMLDSLLRDTPRRLRYRIPHALADVVLPTSYIRYTIKYIRLCCTYREFWNELFPNLPYEVIDKQIRRL